MKIFRSSPSYAMAFLVAAVVTAIGNFLTVNWRYLFAPDPPIKVKIVEPDSGENNAEPKPSPPKEDFSWVMLDANVVYKAESNGFVVAYSGGPKKFFLA